MSDPLSSISNISDSKIRHIVGFLPLLTVISLYGYTSLTKIILLAVLIILSAFFEFSWEIFNKNKDKTKTVMDSYNSLEKQRKINVKEQWIFFKRELNFINFGLFFFTMLFTSIFFIFGMIFSFVHFLLNYGKIPGIFSLIYLFTFVYMFSLIQYNKNYGGRKNDFPKSSN